ncbi:MAG: UDP-N-acetylmuramoyl-tripeptide--D-alanyl-D-alanine ligase [Flavobacteriales bacterium]|nr:UDP-N-acetylmuramoyl-tripeptide--D-alanyl-D-alanine ligase [Flavobacteriales bacterium]
MMEELYRLFNACDRRFTTDTRTISGGELFIALKGEKFNANTMAHHALERGAAYALVDEVHGREDPRLIVVGDVLQTFQELARYHRRQFNIPVLAVGGSNGKTTTKELLISTLSEQFRVHATAGNFNNHIGVPITLLQMPLDSEIAVIEIGTNAFGEIATLCAIVEPSHGVLTNIGKEHLEGFGDLEGVAREESALFDYLNKHHGLSFVNNSDPILANMGKRLANRRTYGIDIPADDCFELEAELPVVRLREANTEFSSNLQGSHNAQNIACTISICRTFGMDNTSIQHGLSRYVPSNNRSQLVQKGSNQILLDAYNANPSSMLAALNTFDRIEELPKYVFLGDMFELGDVSEEEHLAIAKRAFELQHTHVYLVGDQFSKAANQLGHKGYDQLEAVIMHLSHHPPSNAWILIKGSRGMKMESLLESL